MTKFPKDDTKCRECTWSVYLKGKCVLASGYICKINPFRSVVMGFEGIHAERKEHILEEKEERKNRKKGSN